MLALETQMERRAEIEMVDCGGRVPSLILRIFRPGNLIIKAPL